MARMRYVKPEFWTDAKIVGLSFPARLLFIGMWNFALCDQGHVEDDVLRLKMQVFPADAVDVAALVEELLRSGRVERLEASDGHTYLHVVHLSDHQKVDPRWTPRCPACKNADDLAAKPLPDSPKLPGTQESLGELSGTLPNSAQEGIGEEGRGGERRTTSSDRSAARTTERPDAFAEFWSTYPRKEAKRPARTAYDRALKRATAEQILAGATRYRDDPNREAAFTALPASWLNADRWDDEPLPPRNGRSAGEPAHSLWDAYAEVAR